MNKIKWSDLKFENSDYKKHLEDEQGRKDLKNYEKRIKKGDVFAEAILHGIKNKVSCFIKFDNGEWCSIIGCPPFVDERMLNGADWRCYGDGVDTFEIQTSKIYLKDWSIREYLSKSEVLEELNGLKNTKVTKKQKARLQKIKDWIEEQFAGLEEE